MEGMIRDVEKIFEKNDLCTKIVGEITGKMQKIILMDSETTFREHYQDWYKVNIYEFSSETSRRDCIIFV